jgi:hypothetical protein
LTWKRHIDSRYEGYRWLRNASELPTDPGEAAAEIVAQVVRVLRRAEAIPLEND